jgi:rubrerythrin
MPILTPTKDTGGVTKALPGVYAEPDRYVDDESLAAAMADTGLNGAFLADLLSAVLTHERCGRHLYRSLEGRTTNPILQGKYREFGAETERHVDLLETLVAGGGGNPSYLSPLARAVEGTDSNLLQSTFLLRGSIDLAAAEMAMLDAVALAESMDHANWQLMAKVSEQLPPGTLREQFQAAVDEVQPQEDDHLTWALETKERLTLLQLSPNEASSLDEQAEQRLERVRNWLAD